MNKKLFFSALLVLLAFSLVLVSCGGGGKLVGSWEDEKDGDAIELFKNGEGILTGTAIKWRTEGDRLILTIGDQAVSFDYKLDGKTLYLTNNGETQRLKKK